MFGLLLIFVSALFSFLITSYGFPSLGLTVLFVSLALLALKFKNKIVLADKIYLCFTLFFSFALSIWSNGLILFLDILAVFYFGSLFILSDNERKTLDILQVATLPFRLLGRIFQTRNGLSIDWEEITSNKKTNFLKSQEIIISILLTSAILIFVLPLLSSANPLFAKWVNSIFGIFSLNEFLKNLFGYNFPLYFARGVLFILFSFLVPRLLSYIKENASHEGQILSVNLPLFIPKIILSLVLFIFFISQAQLYFATAETLKTLGITHSQYAREVFGQLSVVTLIIFGLVYADRNKSQYSKYLTYLLVIEGVFLSAIALKSVYDYSFNFGFTHKRLLGYTVVGWTWGLYLMFIYSYIKNIDKKLLLGNLIIYSGIVLGLVNLLNFDYLIYHTFRARTQRGVDYQYLATLSPDSYSYHELLKIAENKYRNGEQEMSRLILDNLLWKIDELRYKYKKKLDLRTYNIMEYRQYLEIKDVGMDKYYEIQQKLPPVPVIVPVNVPNIPEPEIKSRDVRIR